MKHLLKNTSSVIGAVQSLTTARLKVGYVPLTPQEHEYAISQFGGPTLTSRQRWNALSDSMLGTKHVEWARLEDGQDPVEHLPCTDEELTLLAERCARGGSIDYRPGKHTQ